MRYLRLAVVPALVLSACGGSDASDTTQQGPTTITVEASEFAFSPDLVSVSEGETVNFVVTNTGSVPHELRLTDQEGIDAHLAGGHDDHSDDDMSGDEHEMVVTVEPGETATLTVTFDGHAAEVTHIACLIPGHYEAGMVGEILVNP